MKKFLSSIPFIAIVLLLLPGCASNPQDRMSVARAEVDRMPAPSKPFNAFSQFELLPFELSEAVQADASKVEVSKQLEDKLRARLEPLLVEWNKNAQANGPEIVIQPRIASLRVVSSGARFWAGALVGDSFIDLDLVISERDSGNLIVQQRINRNANAMGGAWSIGATDKSLLDYIVDIAYQYLDENYSH